MVRFLGLRNPIVCLNTSSRYGCNWKRKGKKKTTCLFRHCQHSHLGKRKKKEKIKPRRRKLFSDISFWGKSFTYIFRCIFNAYRHILSRLFFTISTVLPGDPHVIQYCSSKYVCSVLLPTPVENRFTLFFQSLTLENSALGGTTKRCTAKNDRPFWKRAVRRAIYSSLVPAHSAVVR